MLIIPREIRPIFKLLHNTWARFDTSFFSDGHQIIWGDHFYLEKDLISLKEHIGVYAYLFLKDEILVFDFSASHLCFNQLNKIKAFIYETYNQRYQYT